MANGLQNVDDAVERVTAILEEYKRTNPGVEGLVYRYNPASIRVKIVDVRFQDLSKGERHDYAWQLLSSLPEDILAQISVLLCLAPGESTLLDTEFDNPSRSYL